MSTWLLRLTWPGGRDKESLVVPRSRVWSRSTSLIAPQSVRLPLVETVGCFAAAAPCPQPGLCKRLSLRPAAAASWIYKLHYATQTRAIQMCLWARPSPSRSQGVWTAERSTTYAPFPGFACRVVGSAQRAARLKRMRRTAKKQFRSRRIKSW